MFQDSSFSAWPEALRVSGLGALRVGLVGTGVVGSGTCQLLARNADLIAQRVGRPIRLVMAAARDLHKAAQVVGPDVDLVSDPLALVRHPDIDVVVEVMGGVTLAKTLVLEAIAQGKHVVTANKALLAANRIYEVVGIVNGTTNFILTHMQETGMGFDAALRQATALGFAEADPSFDIEGVDAAHKTALLAAIAFGADVPFAQVHAQGITRVEAWDMVCAQALGYRIKLLGVARQRSESIEVRVHPALVPEKHLLAQVQGSMNGIWVNADAAGPTFHYGAGAGSLTTASAVVADLMDVARLASAGLSARVPYRSVQASAIQSWPLLPIGQVASRHYLRFALHERPELLTCLPGWLQSAGVEVQQLAPVRHPENVRQDALVVLTQSLTGDDLANRLKALPQMQGFAAPAAVWRVEDLNSSAM